MKKLLLVSLVILAPGYTLGDWNDWDYNPLNPITTYDYYNSSPSYSLTSSTANYALDSKSIKIGGI